MSFNRWKPRESYSWCYYVFMNYHSYLNDLLWSHEPSKRFVFSHVNQEDGPMEDRLNFNVSETRRIYSDKEEWEKFYKEFANWTRLNALMSLNSYFEIYLSTVF